MIGGSIYRSGNVLSDNLAIWHDDAIPTHLSFFTAERAGSSVELRWLLNAFTDTAAGLKLHLSHAYPNPFNPRTTISFRLPTPDRARLIVYDMRGRRVATLLDTDMKAGEHAIDWNGTDDQGRALSSGLYYVRLTYGLESRTTTLTMIR